MDNLVSEPSHVMPSGMSRQEHMVWATAIVSEVAVQQGVTVKEPLHEIEQELHMKQLRKVLMK